MNTRELLDCSTSESREYIKSNFSTASEEEFRKLKKLFESKLFEAKKFDDVELDILVFDWQGLNCDRNWWWQIQALPFLNWFVRSIDLQSEEEKIHYFSLCLSAVNCWEDNAKNNKGSPLVWHDHASAFRVRNLVNWLLFCHVSGLPVSENVRADFLADLVLEHLDWLQEDGNYSAYTNHGFDQAMIALTIGLMFSCDELESCRQLNRKRLVNEVTFAFTPEGVHKENSPAYQKFMLGRLRSLLTLSEFGESELPALAKKNIDKAEKFLSAITLPNGSLPMIGDTRGDERGMRVSRGGGFCLFDYSLSGYVVVKGRDRYLNEFCLIFKNCHDSNYHRHDDDLSLFFYYDGEVIFGDGGLFSHQAQDPKRIYIRSKYAHSIPFIDGDAERDRGKLRHPPSTFLNGYMISGKSHAFGVELRRVIDISAICDGVIYVEDSVIGCDVISSNFLIPELDASTFNKLGASLSMKSASVEILCDTQKAGFNLYSGWNSDSLCESAIVSSLYGRSENCSRIVMRSVDTSLAYTINFSPILND